MKIDLVDYVLHNTFVALLSGLTVPKNEKEVWVTSANSGVTVELLDAEKEEYIIRNYWENGQLKWERYFKSDEQHGTSKGYFEDGTPEHTANWVDGKLHGLVVVYYRIDRNRSEATYVNGKLQEGVLWFDSLGNKTKPGIRNIATKT